MAGTQDTIAIAGNPNSGKTTAFNWYTGARQHVGNYPGITVEQKHGTAVLDGKDIVLVDLPGTYSLTAYSLEEVVARRVLANDKPGAVLDVVNAGVLERNLYLTVQILEMGLPVVIVLNMMDEAKAQGIKVNASRLSELLGVKAVPAVARHGEGLEQALREAVTLARNTGGRAEPLNISYGPDIDEALAIMTPIVEDAGLLQEHFPARWVALKFLEHDEDIVTQATGANAEVSKILSDRAAEVSQHVKTTLNTYPEALIADYRYGYISSVLKQGAISGTDDAKNRVAYSDTMDKVLTHRMLGPLIMFGILYLMYFFTIEVGDYPLGWVETFFEWLDGAVGDRMADGPLKSLVTSGIIAGVGGVMGFVPLIMIMFLVITVLEDSGYMARVAYMMDRVFRIFGLHGASVMPFIVSGGIAGGCAVPGVMAARTLRSPRERLATILTAPFMACGAKIPVFLLFVTIFFEDNKALVMFSLTLAGWAAALLVARLLRSTVIKGEATPFVMELPPYRFPTLSGVLIHTWERTWQYIKKAGTVILAISILIWAGMTYPELPEDMAKGFEERKAPLEEQLDATPYKQLKDQIKELEEKIGEADAASPQAKAQQAELDGLNEKMEELPAGKLEMEIASLEEQLEKLPEDAEVDSLREQIAHHEHAISLLTEGSTAAQALEGELESLKKRFTSRPRGALESRKDALQEELDAMPEKELEAKIAEIENEEAAQQLRMSYAGRLGTALEPVSTPAGFDWRTNIALIGGVAAKEVVISTLGTAYSLGEVDEEDASLADRIRADDKWNKANAIALLLFTLLYSPCFVTLAVIKQETGKWRWLFFSLIFNLGLAYCVAVAANQMLRM